MILTARGTSLRSPFLPLAWQVWPKCPRPTSFPKSYLAPKFLLYPKFLSSDWSSPSPSVAPSSGIGPSSGGFALPNLLTREALMCFAGDGGGNGRLKNFLPGVDRPGDGETPPGKGEAPPWGYGLAPPPWGYGLGHGLVAAEDRAGVCLTADLDGVGGGRSATAEVGRSSSTSMTEGMVLP